MAKQRVTSKSAELRASRLYFIEELRVLGALAGDLGYVEAEQFIRIALEAVHDQSLLETANDCCG